MYDVALRDWPVAMLPETALRSDATFDGAVLRHPLREGQPVLSLQIAENTLEQEQQIASVTRTTQRPKRTSAPAFVPYKAAAPIPAILASTQSEVTHHAAKDLNAQTPAPAPKQSEPDSQQKIEDKTPVADLASVETTPALAQPKDIQQKLPELPQKEEGEPTGNDAVLAEQVVSEKVGQNVGPLNQELPSAPAALAMESAGAVEETGNGVENIEKNISTEKKERQLASTTDIQPQNSPTIRTTEVGDEKVEVVTSNSNSLSDATPDENADTQEATLE
ncbi:MAG: SAF domain-containing protein, partial [Pirellulales bacterium]|nr:SAF domain-containing protein [Pirellulales bacterium]